MEDKNLISEFGSTGPIRVNESKPLENCAKCKEKYPTYQLFEIYAFDLQVCESCVREWIPDNFDKDKVK